jgi:hypothetical protein
MLRRAQPATKTSGTSELRENAAIIALLLGWFGGPLILAFQIIGWLKTGHWPSFTLGNAFLMLGSGTDLAAWITKPNSWYGLHRILVARRSEFVSMTGFSGEHQSISI